MTRDTTSFSRKCACRDEAVGCYARHHSLTNPRKSTVTLIFDSPHASESDHVFHLFDLAVEQRTDGSAAGIVDQHGDARIVLQLCFHPREILLVVGVRYDRSDAASGRAVELRRALGVAARCALPG